MDWITDFDMDPLGLVLTENEEESDLLLELDDSIPVVDIINDNLGCPVCGQYADCGCTMPHMED